MGSNWHAVKYLGRVVKLVKFRGHHLVCLHFFKGEGYTQEFICNLKNLVDRAEGGEEIEIVAGADEVCRLCPYLRGDCCGHKHDADEEVKKLDKMALDYLDEAIGNKVTWREVKEKVNSASQEWFTAFCKGCDWEKVCERIRSKYFTFPKGKN